MMPASELEDKINEHRDALCNISELRKRYYSSINKYQMKLMNNELEKIERTRYLDGTKSNDKNYTKEIKNNTSNLLMFSVASLKRTEDQYIPKVEQQSSAQLDELVGILDHLSKLRD